ncbi:hypothetical protein ACFPH6_29470 [Streptomyces xiangluensis]|uniref:Uncharacterized protein n=1 Tax=Streptomyces xiangluensis TaxID=2665720 RepID=A0ABV8YX18_9ACTN
MAELGRAGHHPDHLGSGTRGDLDGQRADRTRRAGHHDPLAGPYRRDRVHRGPGRARR